MMSKHNQKLIEMLNKQDLTVSESIIKILNLIMFQFYIPEAYFKVKNYFQSDIEYLEDFNFAIYVLYLV